LRSWRREVLHEGVGAVQLLGFPLYLLPVVSHGRVAAFLRLSSVVIFTSYLSVLFFEELNKFGVTVFV